MNPFENLQPRAVWAHFATLCAIPHPSLREAALRENLIAWAAQHGIANQVDAAGNLILRKPASPGCEAMPGVILQGHLDMVCQANTGTVHDFERDPIRPVVRDGWVVAENTTLGADNGIGVALALAALEEPELIHPSLEVLLTVNEESGMDGARELAPGALRGKTLLNLDTEEWGHFYLGCAGGVDVNAWRACRTEPVPAGYATWQVGVSGLRGGHSGIDIHLGRGNAIRLLVEFLREAAESIDLRLLGLAGGSARNAIPREAFAVIALPADATARLLALAEARAAEWQQRFQSSDDGIQLGCQAQDKPLTQALASEECVALLEFLQTAQNGVKQMSADFPGVVETSDNLGVASLDRGEWRVTFKVRSLKDDRADALADEIVGHAVSCSAKAEKSGAYPGWTPNPSSPLLELCRQTYQQEFGRPASLQVIHAGLECGLLAASHPQLDMISFGPDIRGAHAPGERVEIESVERCWQLLKATLRALAGKES
jgi:dipeptidase D